MTIVNTVMVTGTESGHFIVQPAFRYHSDGEIQYDREFPLVLSREGMLEVIDELQQALKEKK